jgi:hypothetical protein
MIMPYFRSPFPLVVLSNSPVLSWLAIDLVLWGFAKQKFDTASKKSSAFGLAVGPFYR